MVAKPGGLDPSSCRALDAWNRHRQRPPQARFPSAGAGFFVRGRIGCTPTPEQDRPAMERTQDAPLRGLSELIRRCPTAPWPLRSHVSARSRAKRSTTRGEMATQAGPRAEPVARSGARRAAAATAGIRRPPSRPSGETTAGSNPRLPSPPARRPSGTTATPSSLVTSVFDALGEGLRAVAGHPTSRAAVSASSSSPGAPRSARIVSLAEEVLMVHVLDPATLGHHREVAAELARDGRQPSSDLVARQGAPPRRRGRR